MPDLHLGGLTETRSSAVTKRDETGNRGAGMMSEDEVMGNGCGVELHCHTSLGLSSGPSEKYLR